MGRRGIWRSLTGAIVVLASLAAAPASNAATLNVPCSGGTASLLSTVATANSTLGADTIEITGAPCTFSLTAVADNGSTGNGDGIPTITQPLTINGHGSTISRAAGSPPFRIFFASSAALTLTGLTVSGGSVTGSSVGSGIAGIAAAISLDGVTVTGNSTSAGTAGANGGGIWLQGGSLTVDHSTISNNIAAAGGGIYSLAGPVTVRHTLLSLNGAASVGAAWINGTTATFENDTFAVNYANNGVGGVAASNSGTTDGVVTVSSSTFADSSVTASTVPANSLLTFRNGGTTVGGTIKVSNTVITDTDSAAAASVAACSIGLSGLGPGGTITNLGGNMDFPGTSCPFTTHADAKLVALAANGGSSATYRLQPASPAIDGGGASCPSTDGRELPRPVFAACDSGAFEVQEPTTTATGPSGTTNSTTTTFTGVTDGPTTFECKVDSGSFTACTSPFAPSLADGAHTIAVRATDTYGHSDSTPSSFSFTLDKSNPVVALTSPPTGTITNNSPSLAFTVTDGSATTTTCKLDTAAPVACTSPYSPGPLADGPHTIVVTATDAAANTGSATATFNVDTAAPGTINVPCGDVTALRNAITAANATLALDTINVTGAACTFTLTTSVDATDGGNGLPVVIHPLRINGNGSTINRSNGNAAPFFRILNVKNLVDSAVSLEVHDLTLTGGLVAGNGGGLSATGATVVLDNLVTADSATGLGGGVFATGGALTIDHSSFIFNVAAAGGGLGTVSVSPVVRRSVFYVNQATSSSGAVIQEGGTGTFTNDTFYANVGTTTNPSGGLVLLSLAGDPATANVGSSTFSDNGGASSTPGSAIFPVSSANSVATVNLRDSIVHRSSGNTGGAQLPCNTNAAAGTTPASVINDLGGNIEFPTSSCGAGVMHADPKIAAPVANGGPTVTMMPQPTSPVIDHASSAPTCPATDQRNVARPDGDGCDTGAVETPAPETVANGPASPTNTTTTTFSSPDTPGASFECKVDALAFTACSSPFSPALGDGAHTILVRAVATGGYLDPSPASVSFVVDKTAPVVAITNKPPAVTPNNSFSLNFTVDDGSATVTCSVDSATPVACGSPFVTGTLTDGPHTVKVIATDAAGNAGSDTASFTVDTVPPQTTNVACGEVNALRAAITAANATLALDTISVTGGPCTFTLTTSVDATDGGNGLPVVIHPLRINGNGSTINRSNGNAAPFFRILNVKNLVDSAVSLEVHDLTLTGGLVAGNGGGLSATGATVLADNLVTADAATGLGGGVFATGGSLTVDHSTFVFNAAAAGGGLGTVSVSPVVRRSLFYGNSATSSSGAAIQEGGTSSFTNDTFYGNVGTASNPSGGLVLLSLAGDPATANVGSSTFSDNGGASSTPGSAIYPVSTANSVATVNLRDSIVHRSNGNTGGVQLPCNTNAASGTTPASVINDLGGNIEFPTSSCGAGVMHADPKIGVPAANGGVTLTMLPQPTSPAIDHASGAPTCPATDQRDLPRPDGSGCDTGAVETNAPDTTITGPAADPTNTPTVTMTSDQTLQAFQCKVDGGSFATCTSPFTVPASVPDGLHTVSVRAIDAQGYVDPTPASVTFTIDRTAPVVAITNKPAPVTASTSFSLNFTVDDNAATVTCTVDGAATSPCSSPVVTGTLADGPHTVTVSAKDPVGNVGSDSTTFTIDTAPAQTFTVSCGDVTALRAAITSANATLIADTIELPAGPCTFTLNDSVDPTAGGNGLPIVVHPLTINGHGSTIARNSASGTPAFRVLNASNALDSANSLALHDLTIATGAVAGNGAGLLATGTAVSIDHGVFLGNFSTGQGGAIATSGGSLDIDHTNLQQNISALGAGLSATLTPTTVRRSVLVLNSATSTGSAVVIGGTATFENDTLASNYGSNGIGGITVENSGATNGVVNVSSTTIADSTKTTSPANTAPGGALFTFQAAGTGTASVHVKNSIITDTDSTATATLPPCDAAFGGPITNDGGNIEYPGNSCGFATQADPKLGTFGLNGGSTLNYPLKAGSPAIDLGGSTCPATDQRDKLRFDGAACDSGSYELEVAPVVTITSAPPVPPASTGDNSPSIAFTVDDSSATVKCQVDSAAVVSPCSSPFATGTLADGTHTVTITATDPLGNVGSATTTFKVDTVASQSIDVACNDVVALRAAITAANATLAPDTINVTGGPCTFTLHDSVDATAGGNGLPIVVHPLTIVGHGSTIARDTVAADNTPAFRILLASNILDAANALTLNDLTISGGAVAAPNVGGGLASVGSAITLDHTTFLGNFAGAAGGGVWTSGGTLDVDHSTFQQNFAVTAAGLETTVTSATVRRSTFVLNQASNTGGAAVIGGNVVFENDTFAANIGSNGIGGLAVTNSGTTNGVASVSSSTFADSTGTTTAPAGALVTAQNTLGSATITVKNTIVTDTDSVAAPTSIKPCDTSLGGTITNAGGNLEYPGNTCGFGTQANPKLAAFALNGGVVGTYRLLPGSPAIDLGGSICPATDARDFARPDGPACDSGSYEVDSPETSAVGPTAPTSTPTITFTSDHPGSTFQCRVDGGAFAACSSPYTPVFPTNGSGDGPHTVDVRATDPAGYVDPTPASVTFTYFSVPDTAITSGPSGGSTIYNPTATFTFTSTKTPALFECSFDAGPFTACTTPKTYNGLTEGSHTFAVRAKDTAGHVDPTPATATFTYHHCLIIRITLGGTTICLI